MTHAPQRLITIADAATAANRHTATIRRWITSGDLTAWRVNRSEIRVDSDELAQLIAPTPLEVRSAS